MDQAEKLRNVIKRQNQTQKLKSRVITITSGKGGVGKSNVAVNLAIQFTKLGKRVLIFDADFGLANVEVMFGTIPQYNVGDLIYRGKNIQEIITRGPMGIGFVSGGSGIMKLNNLARDQVLYFVKCLKELDEYADIIIIDTGAGVSDQVLEFVMASPEILLITTPEPSSLTDSYSLLKALYRNPSFLREETRIRMISNRVTSYEEGKIIYNKLNSVVQQFLDGELEYLGMIPQDAMLDKSVRQQKTVSINAPGSKSARAFETMAANLISGDEGQIKLHWGISQLFSDFFKYRN